MSETLSKTPVWEVIVRTGDRRRAGTNCEVTLVLEGGQGERSLGLVLNKPMHNDLERGQTDTYTLKPEVMGSLTDSSKLVALHISSANDEEGVQGYIPNWFVDCIEVRHVKTYENYTFPVLRWLQPEQRLSVALYDTALPKHERHPEQRKQELMHKQNHYQYTQNVEGIVQASKVPHDEHFSFNYSFNLKWDLGSAAVKAKIHEKVRGPEFESLDEIGDIYRLVKYPVPSSIENWRSDFFFGTQRIAGLNNCIIKRVIEKIPDKFPVTNDLLAPLLEGHTIESAIENKKLYISDYDILHNFPVPDKSKILCAPIGLFYVNKKEQLLPVAIQLFQKPAADNPVFTPQDPEPLWCLVKIWFNHADAAVHQAVTHLGSTHLLMEGVVVATNRCLSPSHPVFKLLAPHFLYLLAIDDMAVKELVNPGGWVDKVMTYGGEGIMELARRALGRWRMDVQGAVPRELEARGVADAEATLPGYHYRDDAVPVYEAVRKYVKAYVSVSYADVAALQGDGEVAAWGRELAVPVADGGLAMQGVPGNGEFKTFDDLVEVLTCVIFTCSAAHAAANFPQYDYYGYPPAFPGLLRGAPPKTKSADVTEATILAALPERQAMLDMMVVTQVLSQKATKSLGDFEIQYVAEPRALAVLQDFRADLERISKDVAEKNRTRVYKYDCLDPKFIPNAISI